ncbi:MAG: WD40 repeat domain-containing protein, partial [Myxococcales bacterium]|nr:WD40 repeat domain-containing protein [Myxococcales bacterium]
MHRHHDARPGAGARLRSSPHSTRVGVVTLAATLALAACHHHRPGPDAPKAGTTDGDTGAASQGPVGEAWSRPGAGHTSNIDMVAIASDGSAVLTRDQIGGTRLWPVLDGSVEPIVIPVQGPQQFSVARQPKGGMVVGAIDAAGGAKIFGVSASGEVSELGSLAPFEPLFGIYALPGGQRLLALYRDHAIRLVDPSGAELTRFEERRFRPTSLRVAADGKTFAAVVTSTGTAGKIELQRLRVAEAAGRPTIERAGAPRLVDSTNGPSDTAVVMAPDGKRMAVVDKPVGNNWEILVADLAKDGADDRVQVAIPGHIIPNVGFVSDHELLVSANDGSLSWLVNVEDGSQHARTSAPQDFVNQGRAQAVAGGMQAVGHGTWLFVHDLGRRSHRYLGYRSFQTQSVAVSPSGEWVAWAYMQGPVFVESLGKDQGRRVKLPSEPNFGTLKVRFFDDDHLITVDGAGGIGLYRWRDATLVDQAGIHGALRALHFEPSKGVMLIERHNNDARLFEVSTKGFVGPYIVADQSFRAGLLSKGAPGHEDAVMWTLDSGNRLRHYSLEELRSDPSQEAVMAKGEPIPPGKVAPLAIDRLGRHYGVRWNGSTMELFVDFGKHLQTKVSASGDVSAIVPSPSGKRFVAIHQRGQSTSLSVHDSATLDEQWSFATGVFNNEVEWSPDGRYVAVAANTGAVVLDAKTGKPVQQRCGIEFEALGAPPATAFNSLNLRSMCE